MFCRNNIDAMGVNVAVLVYLGVRGATRRVLPPFRASDFSRARTLAVPPRISTCQRTSTSSNQVLKQQEGLGVPERLTTSRLIQASNIDQWRKARCPESFDSEQPAILVPVPRCGAISNIPPVLAATSSVSRARTASHGSMEGNRGGKDWGTDHCQKKQSTRHRNVLC